MIPLRLRPTTEKSIGTTAFFRNRALLNTVCDKFAELENKDLTVLFHACSIGSEVYSFLIRAMLHPKLADKNISVFACDYEEGFLAFAERALFPKLVLEGMLEEEKTFFEDAGAENVRPQAFIREKINFLPACSFQDFVSPILMDVVFLLNAFMYVPREVQTKTIKKIAEYNRHYFITTGFHFDNFKKDMQAQAYSPCLENAKAIHDGWTDRRKAVMDQNEIIPDKIFHPWSLPPYQKIPDYEYIYSAIFKK